jgi:hypothetical protein
MRLLFAFVLFVSVASAQQLDHARKLVKNLRQDCVAAERLAVAVDANDFSHVKTNDNVAAGYCEGFIAGFIVGTNHQPIQYSRHTYRAIVAYIDEHPNELDLRKILSAALKDDAE